MKCVWRTEQIFKVQSRRSWDPGHRDHQEPGYRDLNLRWKTLHLGKYRLLPCSYGVSLGRQEFQRFLFLKNNL